MDSSPILNEDVINFNYDSHVSPPFYNHNNQMHYANNNNYNTFNHDLQQLQQPDSNYTKYTVNGYANNQQQTFAHINGIQNNGMNYHRSNNRDDTNFNPFEQGPNKNPFV